VDDDELMVLGGDMPPAAFRWDLLDDADHRERSRQLEAFVNWLVTRYRLQRRIPPCWWRHGAYVEELSSLFVAWRGVMEAERRTDSWLQWHYQLSVLLHRCSELWNTGCGPDRHVDVDAVRFAKYPEDWSGVT
jgi:hypothetical protein